MQLEAFFREKFGQEVRIFQVIKSEAGYNLFIQLKDRKAPLVCRMNLSVAGRDTIKSQPILVLAKTGDNELRTFLEEFIEKRQDKRFRMGLN